MAKEDDISKRMYPPEARTLPPPSEKPLHHRSPREILSRVQELIAKLRESDPAPQMGPNARVIREKDLQAAEALELLAHLVDRALTASDPRNFGG